MQTVVGNIGGTSNSFFDFSPFLHQPVDGFATEGVQFGFSTDPTVDAVLQNLFDLLGAHSS